jgi:hypothetical protein
MCRLMGFKGWTGHGRTWAEDLVDPSTYGGPSSLASQNAPPRTKVGRYCWRFLVFLRSVYKTAPRSPALRQQNVWFRDKKPRIEKICTNMESMITKICEKHLAVMGDEENDATGKAEYRQATCRDLIDYIIPMLISLLQTIFFLGGEVADDDNKKHLPAEGVFTKQSLSSLSKTARWTFRVYCVLIHELQKRPLDASDPEPSGDEGDRSAIKKVDGRAKAKRTAETQRKSLGSMVHDFQKSVDEALKALESSATREERKKLRFQRELQLREATAQQEKAELLQSQRRWQAMCASVNRLKDMPHPMHSKWKEKLAIYEVQKPKPRHRRIPWLERDTQWLLGQLRSHKGHVDLAAVSAVVERDWDDIRLEIEFLKLSIKSVARERGVPVEPWVLR